MSSEADAFIEISWEVCNKVGGIYTVLMSKANQIAKKYGENYYVIGPYFHEKAVGEFEEDIAPNGLKGMFDKLKQQGITCHFGKWLIKGEPKAILIDFSGFNQEGNTIKGDHWDKFKIDSLNAPGDYTEPVVWGTAAGILVEQMLDDVFKGKKVVCQFHEWLAGSALLYLKSKNAKVGKVFTTHATMLGRSMAGGNFDIYGNLDKIDADKEAYNYGAAAKHQMEKACANNADVFTTVSEITGMEAQHLLGRKPDVLLPNGLDMETFPSFEESSIRHKNFKYRIKEFILYNFFPYQDFNLDETLIYFTLARYEFQNKGLDVYIDALGKLNEQMKKEKSDKTVVAFFFIPSGIKGIKSDLIENKRYYEDVKESVDAEIDSLHSAVTYSLISKKTLTKENLFTESFLTETKKKLLKFHKPGKNPSIATHDLSDEQGDQILRALSENGLHNKTEDRVKVVYYPTYLTGADGLLDLAYYETITGAHLGVFPSYYEPWGYTPLEAAALGVASVTTDLSGFGKFICGECAQIENPGVYVLERLNKSYDDIVQGLYNILYHYASLTKDGRIENKIEAHRVAELADWKKLIKNYFEAHSLAATKIFG